MRILRPGHRYALDTCEPTPIGGQTQVIQFIEKEQVCKGAVELRTVFNGTTNEDVLRVLIDRMNFLQEKVPCRENALVITKLEESLMWLDKRTSDRIARKVEGQNIE